MKEVYRFLQTRVVTCRTLTNFSQDSEVNTPTRFKKFETEIYVNQYEYSFLFFKNMEFQRIN